MVRDFKWLQDETSKILNFNSSQSDQAFTSAQAKESVNDAYIEEVNSARLQCSAKYFRTTMDLTWSSGDVTFTVPSEIAASPIEEIKDVTDNDPGYRLIFERHGHSGNLFWKDGSNSIIQWGEAGPPSDKTLRFVYLAEPIAMVTDAEEPSLVPTSHRRLIALSAAISMREMADEAAPQAWSVRLQNYRLDFWKHVRLGRPMTDVPVIVGDNADVDVGYVF